MVTRARSTSRRRRGGSPRRTGSPTAGQAGFDGDLIEEIRRFDATVLKAGWRSGPSGIEMPIDYYRRYRGRPEGSRAYDAGNLPGVGYDGRLGARCEGVERPWGLGQRWLEAGQPLDPGEQDGPIISRDCSSLYQHTDPLDHRAAKTALLAAHHYVAVVTMTIRCTYPVGH